MDELQGLMGADIMELLCSGLINDLIQWLRTEIDSLGLASYTEITSMEVVDYCCN